MARRTVLAIPGTVPILLVTALATAPTLLWAQEPGAGTPLPPPPAHVLGCYDVTLGPWTELKVGHVVRPSGPPPAGDSVVHAMPPRIELSDGPPSFKGILSRGRRPDAPPAWSAAAPEGALPVGAPIQSWRWMDDGSIHLMYFDGFAGTGGRLAPDGEGWRGTMEALTDVAGLTRWGRETTLSRVDCASPPPVTDASVWLLPRSIELEGGMTLTLGEAPPEGLPTYDRPRRAPGVAAATAGVFTGADSVVMVTTGDVVGLVELTFLPPAAADDLVARLTETMGAPVAHPPFRPPGRPDSVPLDPRPVSSYSWYGRITRLAVVPGVRGGFRVILNDPRIR